MKRVCDVRKMSKESHENKKNTLTSLLSFIALIVISMSFISAAAYLEGNKAVSPNVLYVGDNTTITLSVSGAGDSYIAPKSTDVILVVDTSCSMYDGDINEAKAAAKLFVAKLNPSLDRVGLVSFNTNSKLEVGLTNNYASVVSAIDALSCAGYTNIGGAILKATTQFSSSSNSKVIVLVSDGNANRPIFGRVISPTRAKSFAIEQATNAGVNNILVHTIGIGSDVDSNTLRSIATAGKGLYFHYPFGNAIDGIFNGVVQQASNVAGTNIIVTDVLEEGVVPFSWPSACVYNAATRTVTCNAGSLNIGETRTFSLGVTVYNSALTHLNVIAHVNYSNYQNTNVNFILNNPNVTILSPCVPNACIGNVAPQIQIISPLNNHIYNNSFVISINATDSNLNKVWYNLNGGENISYVTPVTVIMPSCQYRLYAFANDSCGNLSSTYVDFFVCNQNYTDDVPPIVIIQSPLEGHVYNTSRVLLNISAKDNVAIDSVWYGVNGSNISYSDFIWMNLSNGNYTIKAYANDSSGNVGSDVVNFRVNVINNSNDNPDSDDNPDCDKDPDCDACRGHTRAPVDDFNTESVDDSISITDDYVIALNYENNTAVDEGFNLNGYIDEKYNQLIFNMILLISILILILLIFMVKNRN